MVLVNQIQKKTNAEKSLEKGRQLWLEDRLDHAVHQGKNAYAVFKSIGDWYGVANASRLLGECELSKKNVSGACRWFEESFEMFKTLGNLNGVSTLATCLGDCYKEIGDNDRAMSFYRRAIKSGCDPKESHFLARAYEGMADIYGQVSNFKETLKYLKKSLILRREGKKNGCDSCQAKYWNTLFLMLYMCQHTNQNKKALGLFKDEGVIKELKDYDPRLRCLLFAFLSLFTNGDESKQYSKDAREIAKDIGDQSLIDKCLEIIYSDKSDQTNE